MPAASKTVRHLLFLNRSYFPDAEATGQLLTELCEDLSGEFNVTVIAGQPNQNPQQALYRRRGVEERNGVRIHRVWNSRLPKRWLPARAVNLLSYLATATFAGLTTRRPDVVVVETDPPLLCLLGALLKWRFRCKLIVYLQDIHPELGIALGRLRDNWRTRLLRRSFSAAYRRADRIIVLSEDMQSTVIEANAGMPNVEVIPNWVDTTRIKPIKTANAFRAEHDLDNKFVVMYSGNLGLCQGLENVLDAAELLCHRDDVMFLLIGNGALKPHLVQTAEQRNLRNVRFVDYQPISRLAESLSAADLHLVPVDSHAIRYLMPSKLYSALASGTPVVTVAPRECELARLVEEHRVGFNVPPDEPESLAERILWLVEWCDDRADCGARARELATAHFDRSVGVERFRSVLREISGNEPAPVVTEAAQPVDV